MTKKSFEASELIVNGDGTIYHLAVGPAQVADTVLIVGDQGRVEKISRHFDRIDFRVQNREFKTHTGEYLGKRISVMSTGIGTDNIDIFINELDAAVNIDLQTKQLKPTRRRLNIIRIGTTGGLHADVPVGSHIISQYALGFDGLLHYYDYPYTQEETDLCTTVSDHLDWDARLAAPYIVKGSESLVSKLGHDMISGITATAPGFYGPQGRSLYLQPRDKMIYQKLHTFRYNDLRINNLEMETSALYGLGSMLGHECCTCCVVLANRATGAFSKDHGKTVDHLIQAVLQKLVSI